MSSDKHMRLMPVEEDYSGYIVKRSKRVRLIAPVREQKNIQEHYTALGWQQIFLGPAPRAEGGVDVRRFVVIFEKDEAQA